MNIALDPARSISVAASAGSGKTWQLVSRIVRLLLAGAEPGSILALTFTRKAAAEMRERVELRLRELAYAEQGALDAALGQLDLTPTPALRDRARRLHERLLYAPFALRAQTLHVFCHELLSRFPLEAGVPAGYALVEDEREVREEALAALMSQIRLAPESAEAQALAVWIAAGASESTILGWLSGFIDRRSDWWAWTKRWTRDGLDVAAEAAGLLAAQLGLDPDDDHDPCVVLDEPGCTARIRSLKKLLADFKGIGHLKADMLDPALEAAGRPRHDALGKALFTQKLERRSLKQKDGISDSAWQDFSHGYDLLATQLEALREQLNKRATWRNSAAGYRLGVALLGHLADALTRAHALSFADLEWRTCQLLRDPEHSDWVRYKLDQRIEHLLLDEFQDTSPTQWSLLLPLLEEMAAGDEARPRTAFIVGDGKQSIYGFRRANPELLRSAADYLSTELAGAAMPLNASRRSAPAIIAFVNALFAGADGDTIAFEPHDTYRRSDWGAIEVAALVQAEEAAPTRATEGLRNPLTTPRQVAEDLRLRREAEGVAARIRALVAARLPIIDGSAARALDWGDVMILARQRTHLHAIERALAEAGIPFVGSSRGTLLDTVLARDLMALLRFLDAPHRNLELAQVLRSPLFAASDEDLMQLAQASEFAEGGSWWARLSALAEAGRAGPGLRRASTLIAKWQRQARRLPAHDLLDRICYDTDLAARYEAALPGDTRLRANLGAFLQLVLDSDQGRYPTLGRLNRELETLAAAGNNAPSEVPPAAVDGQVRVLTIHASKGLEAPAVFLVNSAPADNNRHGGWQVEWPSNQELPTHFLLAGNAGERDELSTELIKARRGREAREALNLLYVAVTRARQFLFVSAFESSKSGPERSWHQRCLDAAQALPSGTEPLPGAADGVTAYRDGRFPTELAEPPEALRPAPIDPRLRAPLAGDRAASPTPSDGSAARDPDAVTRGRAIHWLLQQQADGRPLAAATLALRLGAALGSDIDAALLPGWQQEAQAVLAAPELAMLFSTAALKQAWNEVPVQWQGDDGRPRGGVIDRLTDDGERLWIIDYKTAPRPDAECLVAQHRAQLEAYAEAIGKVFPGRSIRAGLVLTATARWLPVLERPA